MGAAEVHNPLIRPPKMGVGGYSWIAIILYQFIFLLLLSLSRCCG